MAFLVTQPIEKMSTLTIAIRDVLILRKIQEKSSQGRRLSSDEEYALTVFLKHLPSTEIILKEKYSLGDEIEVKIFDIKEMWTHMENWIDLFNNLPNNGNKFYPSAGLNDTAEDKEFWKTNFIINGTFVPSFAYSKRGENENKIISVHLKTDGTAIFELYTLDDIENFPELYHFKGSWKEAYLLTVKTLQQGWPQTKFPAEFKPFLKK